MSTFEGGLGDLSLDRRHILPNQAWISLNTDLKTEIGALRAVHDNLFIGDLPVNVNSINSYLNRLLMHSGNNLYYGNFVSAKRAFSNNSPMDMVKFEGNAYICNGDEFLKFDGSTFVDPFIDPPSSAGITLSDGGAGNLSAGIYSYKYTWRPKDLSFLSAYDQEESPPSLPKALTITASRQITHSGLPTSTLYNLVIWRQKLGEGSEYREVIQIEDNSTTYTDNLFFQELGEDILKTDRYATPPIPRHISLHNRNLFMGGITSWPDSDISKTILDNYLLVSDDGRMSGWPKFALDIIGETDDRIMNHLPLTENALLVYTKGKIIKVTGQNLLSYRQESTRSPIGLAAEWVLADTVRFGHLILGSNRELNLFDGNSINIGAREQFRRVDAIFSKFSEYPHRINWGQRELCRMSFFNGIGYLAYPTYDSLVNNRVLRIDMRTPSNIIFNISDWGTTWMFPDIGNNVFYMGDSSGTVREIEGDPDNYRAATHWSRDEDNEDIIADKNFKKMRIDYKSPVDSITAEMYVDDVLNNSVSFKKATRGQIDRIPERSFTSPNKGKRASVKLSIPASKEKIVIYDAFVEINKSQRP